VIAKLRVRPDEGSDVATSFRKVSASSGHAMTSSRSGQLLLLGLCFVVFIYLILALSEVGGPAGCHWAFPRWFGCVLYVHETLAGGLIGAAGALIAASIAWTAVQQQINAERERRLADRSEAERLLAEDLSDYADGMAAAWRLLIAVPDPLPETGTWEGARKAAAYMAERLSRPDRLANYQAMAEILGWDRRRKYVALIKGLEKLAQFSEPDSIKDPEEVLSIIRNLADQFEYCLPQTSRFFSGLWRRSPKAMSFADFIGHIGGSRYGQG
jgi:hypothetical protein